MKVSTDGLIIREQIIKEQDKLVTVLTRSNGILRAFVHGAKNLKSSKSAATGLLTYSRLSVYSSRDKYIIDDASAEQMFMPLRNNVEKLALAQYFCELLMELAPENSPSDDFLRLVLNSLYLLCKGDRSDIIIKSAFELRLLTLAGYMPDLICCNNCKCYENEDMYFLPQSGILLCKDCINSSPEKSIKTGIGVTAAMRHCVYAEFQKLFAFTLSENGLEILEHACEEYIFHRLGKNFKTLAFYKQIRTI